MKELNAAEFQAEVLKEYALLSNDSNFGAGAKGREEAERRVRARLAAEQAPSKQGDSTTAENNEWRKGLIWFKPKEVRQILAVGAALGCFVGLLFAIIVLIVALFVR